MAKFQDGNYGTAAGVTLIAKVLAGRCTLKYTKATVGKGSIPDGKTPKTMDGSAEYVMDVPISGVTNPVDGECQVSVQVSSANVQTGFYCTNVVLYAQDPDVGEVPFTYLVLENEPEWIHPASSSVGKVTAIDLISAVGDVDRVEAIIDENTIATIKAVTELIKEHGKDPEAHAAAIAAAASAAVDNHNGSENAHSDIRASVDAMNARMAAMNASVKAIELRFSTNVTKNPFSATFRSLDGLTVSGVWNANLARIEF